MHAQRGTTSHNDLDGRTREPRRIARKHAFSFLVIKYVGSVQGAHAIQRIIIIIITIIRPWNHLPIRLTDDVYYCCYLFYISLSLSRSLCFSAPDGSRRRCTYETSTTPFMHVYIYIHTRTVVFGANTLAFPPSRRQGPIPIARRSSFVNGRTHV